MTTKHAINQSSNIFLYDWFQENMQCQWDWDSFGRDILDQPNAYQHYLNNQNASSGDRISPFDYGSHCLKQYSFCRHDNADEYVIVNIKDLLNDWKRAARPLLCDTIGDDDYLQHKNFRKGPIKGISYGYHRIRSTVRTVKHSRMILNEWSRLKDDRIVGCASKRQDLMAYAAVDWDYTYRTNTRSWKDQSKKRKQWS